MAAISSGQVMACLLSPRTRAAASSALNLPGLPAGTGGAAWVGWLAAVGRGAAVFPDGAALAALRGVRLEVVFFCLAGMMLLPWTRLGTGQCACRAAHQGQHCYLAGGTRSRQFRREWCCFQPLRHGPQPSAT